MKRKNKYLVEDFMHSAVIAVKESDPIRSAEFEMNVAAIRHMPVIDEKNHVIGVLSHRDVVRVLATGSRSTPVAEVMSRAVQTVRPSTLANEAASMMIEQKIGCLPVVNDAEEIVGIITTTDFLVAAERALRGLDLLSNDDA